MLGERPAQLLQWHSRSDHEKREYLWQVNFDAAPSGIGLHLGPVSD
jgi:hypothetical protein